MIEGLLLFILALLSTYFLVICAKELLLIIKFIYYKKYLVVNDLPSLICVVLIFLNLIGFNVFFIHKLILKVWII